MKQVFEDLYEALKQASGEMFPEIPNFARRPPRDEFVSTEVLNDNVASKVDRILSGFLGIKTIDERGKTAEQIAHEKYLMFVDMSETLRDTKIQINYLILNVGRAEIEELKKLKYLQSMFKFYTFALEIDIENAFLHFRDVVRQNLGRRIESEMIKKNISVQQFANKLHFAPLSIRRYLMGTRTPTAETLYQIAYCLNVSVDYLLGLETSNNANNQE